MIAAGIDTNGRDPIVSRDVPLRDGWVLRVAADPAGAVLHLALGRGEGREWRERPDVGGLTLPLEDLEGLASGLLKLHEEGSMSDEHMTFHVGDSDLRFLGLAAALLARYHMRRKGGSVPIPGVFPQSDEDALRLLREGVEMGAGMALDDVPELHISVDAKNEVVHRLLDLAR